MTKQSRKNSTKGSGIRSQNSILSAIDFITLVFCGWIIAYMSAGISRAPEALRHIPVYVGIAIGVLILAWLQQQKGWIPASAGTTRDKAGTTREKAGTTRDKAGTTRDKAGTTRDKAGTTRDKAGTTRDKAGTTIIWKQESKKAQILLFIRSIYPVLLFGYFFTSGHVFNRIIFINWLDPWFMSLDKSIFGYYPSLTWGQTYSQWAVQELFHFAYFCYYPMIVGLPVYLYFNQKEAFKELIFNLTFVFYLCYSIYSVLPVIGGRFIPEAMELTKTYHAGLFTHIMVFIYRTSNHLGGAFPSSHIAVTIVLTVAALRFVPKLGYVFTVIALFLSLATVFCHYHWFIDAVAGVFTGIAGYYLANYVRFRLQKAGFN